MKNTFFEILASIVRYILGFFLLLVLFVISACDSIGKFFGKENTEYKSPDHLAIEHQSKIMDCFINKDPKPIKNLLSEYIIKKYPDIDEQIDKAFNFLDGEIVSYDEPFPSACGAREQKAYGSRTRHIITDKSTEYKIAFKGWYSYDKEPEKIGITSIGIENITMWNKLKSDNQLSDNNEDKWLLRIGYDYKD